MKPPHIHSRGSRASGDADAAFTLIEMILVIAIIVLVVGAMVPIFGGGREGRDLRETADALEGFARSARSSATYGNTVSHILFTPAGFSLVVRKRPDPDQPKPEDDLPADDKTSAGAAESAESFTLPAGVVMQVRPWTMEKWEPPGERVWTFQSSGLCEPIAVRLKSGEAWMELVFSPLTAEIQDESYVFP